MQRLIQKPRMVGELRGASMFVQVSELESPGIAWLRWRDSDWWVHYLPRPASVLRGAAEVSPSMTVFLFSCSLIIIIIKKKNQITRTGHIPSCARTLRACGQTSMSKQLGFLRTRARCCFRCESLRLSTARNLVNVFRMASVPARPPF